MLSLMGFSALPSCSCSELFTSLLLLAASGIALIVYDIATIQAFNYHGNTSARAGYVSLVQHPHAHLPCISLTPSSLVCRHAESF